MMETEVVVAPTSSFNWVIFVMSAFMGIAIWAVWYTLKIVGRGKME